MATPRLSRLHKRIVQGLAAEPQRTTGGILSRHEELVQTLQRDKGPISRSPPRGIKGLQKLPKVGMKRQ